jgi:hypothetical protein
MRTSAFGTRSGAISGRTGVVGAPSPDSDPGRRRPLGPGLWCVDSVRLVRVGVRGGRVGQNDRSRWLGGRPSPTGGHAGRGRDRSGRVPRDRRWSRFHSRPPHTLRKITVCGAGAAPMRLGTTLSTIMGPPTRPASGLLSPRPSDDHLAGGERDHRRSRGTRRRRARRGRACPHVGDGRPRHHGIRWFCPSDHVPPERVVAGRWNAPEAGSVGRICVRSGSGTARQPHFHDQVDIMGLTGTGGGPSRRLDHGFERVPHCGTRRMTTRAILSRSPQHRP